MRCALLSQALQEKCAKQFQELEAERIDFTRKHMWLHTNLLSITYAHNDQVPHCLQ